MRDVNELQAALGLRLCRFLAARNRVLRVLRSFNIGCHGIRTYLSSITIHLLKYLNTLTYSYKLILAIPITEWDLPNGHIYDFVAIPHTLHSRLEEAYTYDSPYNECSMECRRLKAEGLCTARGKLLLTQLSIFLRRTYMINGNFLRSLVSDQWPEMFSLSA